ncbi:hypothetical protein J2809_004206 [Arthrobacter pascens]|uniref:hypothetical protein n=1 Tax=Arthrobacter pascens TaxID=1677 RepID=UPI002860BE76|nr:hypothetical protein [Arthrobacter pascens]MDR6559823.1 hypothetical protein [Arthrobacter pascens]
MSSKWEQGATICAAIGLVVTSLFSWQAQLLSEKAVRVSQDTYAISESAYISAHASRFFLGEVPPGQRQGTGPGPELAAINANPIDIYAVWVEGTLDGKQEIVRIWTVQACTGYRFPAGYAPNKLYFSDGTNSWIRSSDGQLSRSPERNPVPETDSGLETHTFNASGCA